jgi:hypothetical protein
VRMHAVGEQERAAEELEERLLDREQLNSLDLGWELEGLEARECTLEAERKALEDARLTVMAHELTADVRESNLDT